MFVCFDVGIVFFFFFKQKTAYEMRISDWSSDVCSFDLRAYSLLDASERTGLTVAQVYLDVLTRREFVRLAEENLKSHERIFDQIKLRTDRGVGSGADLDQAEARMAQARNNLKIGRAHV